MRALSLGLFLPPIACLVLGKQATVGYFSRGLGPQGHSPRPLSWGIPRSKRLSQGCRCEGLMGKLTSGRATGKMPGLRPSGLVPRASVWWKRTLGPGTWEVLSPPSRSGRPEPGISHAPRPGRQHSGEPLSEPPGAGPRPPEDMLKSQPHTCEPLRPLEAGRGRKAPPLEPQGECGSANTWTADSWLWGYIPVVSSPPVCETLFWQSQGTKTAAEELVGDIGAPAASARPEGGRGRGRGRVGYADAVSAQAGEGPCKSLIPSCLEGGQVLSWRVVRESWRGALRGAGAGERGVLLPPHCGWWGGPLGVGGAGTRSWEGGGTLTKGPRLESCLTTDLHLGASISLATRTCNDSPQDRRLEVTQAIAKDSEGGGGALPAQSSRLAQQRKGSSQRSATADRVASFPEVPRHLLAAGGSSSSSWSPAT